MRSEELRRHGSVVLLNPAGMDCEIPPDIEFFSPCRYLVVPKEVAFETAKELKMTLVEVCPCVCKLL
jgi:hypothetical protein